MGCGKDLAEGEKVLVIKEIAKVKTNKSIAERINHCVITKIGESVRICEKNPSKRKPRSDRGGFNLFSMRDMNRLGKNVDRMPGATREIILNKDRLANKA